MNNSVPKDDPPLGHQAVHGPSHIVEAVGIAASRLGHYSEAIAQGHGFGIQPGPYRELWSIEYQREATPIYAETLPWHYLAGVSSRFERIAAHMTTLAVPEESVDEWAIIQQYLCAASRAIAEAAPTLPPRIDGASLTSLESTTPPVMAFARLAELAHPDGARQLSRAAEAVERLCAVADCPLSDDEKCWIYRLIRGDRVLDIAVDAGFSERSFYRLLGDLWSKLGVDNKTEGIALVTARGWIV